MTLPISARLAGPYTCNAVLTTFSFAFKVFSSADVAVVQTSAMGVETTLTLTTHYTVALNADQENNPGGTITTLTAYPAANKITIIGALTYGQTAELTNGGGYFPKVIEYAMDRLAILIQQLKERVDRSVQVDVSSGTDPAVLIDNLTASTAAAAASSAAASASAAAAAGSAVAAANAIPVGSLGYTPVNKVGDTMTGPLVMSGAATTQAEGAAVASAATCNIWATDGDTRHVTGTATIGSFGAAPQVGAWKKIIFDGALTLTHSANLNLNGGGGDVNVAADDIALVYADTTTQADVFVIRKSGVAVVVAASGVTAVSGTAPVVSSGGAAPAISMAAASAGAAGHMSAAYASKLDGIAAGATVGETGRVPIDAGNQGVGTMALMAGADVAAGGTVAGSSLVYVCGVGDIASGTGSLGSSGVAPAGTWRNISTDSTFRATFFQRIA